MSQECLSLDANGQTSPMRQTVEGILKIGPGADLGGGCRGCAPPPSPRDDLWFSNTTGIPQKKTMWFIGDEVEQETSAPPPNKNPGSAPEGYGCIVIVCYW